ncbi:MAG: hypothetical protein K0R51_1154 [Cytophagaceae bacterium]|nr:hypothetical protein [Cytophagaceae bacterium]
MTAIPLSAQHLNHGTCGAEEMNKISWKKSSNKLRHERSEEIIFNRTIETNNKRTSAGDYVIPVVVHVIHENGTENISDAQIITAIQYMNDAFNNTGGFADPNGTATGIQFCLAKQDALGNATSGITRHQSALTDLSTPSQDMALKNIVRWDPSLYLNVWIVKEITSESAGAGVAGYAYFPSTHGSLEDGVVCEARYFAGSPDDSKIAVHELGHYLGLYHTFEGGCVNNNCLLDGDRVCDTPPDASSAPALCAALVNTCNSDSDDPSTNNPFRTVALGGLGDQRDMISNYMDYGAQICQILFTVGQKDRMVAALTGLRASLLESHGCTDPCPSPIQIAFTPADTSVAIGAVVQFDNQSTGASAYEWRINGTVFSTAPTPTYTFPQQGIYTITLSASNGIASCRKDLSIKVQVLCNTLASFTGPRSVRPGEAFTFTNTTAETNSYEWFVNGTSVATTEDLTHTFGLGASSVQLVTYNGQCYDTSSTLLVESANCNLSNESKIWRFGNLAGLDFSGDTAVYILQPFSIPLIEYFADEACVSVNDANGNFLFYANPQVVFNKNYVKMPNGSGLKGSTNATQMASVNHPSNPNLHYLFTVGALDVNGDTDGLNYSIVDMTLENGLGDVVASSKNTLLLAEVTEKITTVKHANGIDTWIVVHERDTDAFLSYLLTATGINAPVVSHTGIVHVGQGVGQMKFSPDGCKVALAKYDEKSFEICNFDNQSGILSAPLNFVSDDYHYAYGLEFSPDGSKLYLGIENVKIIYQFDMTQTTAASIAASRVYVGNIPGTAGIGAFQLGPYGKIYIARTGQRWLGVIGNPNAPGLMCELKINGVYLGYNESDPYRNLTNMSRNGLPCFSQQYFYDPTPVITGFDTVSVNSTAIPYTISRSSCSTMSSSWTFIGRGTIISSNDTLALVNFSEEEGIDTLIAQRNSICGITIDTFFIQVKKFVLDIHDTIQCTATPVLLDAGSGYVSYLWQDNSTLQTFLAPGIGKYWVTATTEDGYSITDTVRVKSPVAPVVSIGPDIEKCPGAITLLDAGSGYGSYEWQDHSIEQTYSAYLPGKYWVTVTDVCGSKASDTMIIAADVDFSLGANGTLCPGETLVLNAGNNYTYYHWQDHSSSATHTVTQQGTYWVVVSDGSGCYGYDTVKVYTGNDCCIDINIPSLITPNKDGKNESFEVSCIANQGWLLEIYNRWGSVVYHNDNYSNSWNAENASDGVYFYLLKKKDREYRGWVQVTR